MEDVVALAIFVGIVYIVFRYVIPFIWNKLVVPLGKFAYLLILITIGFSFYFLIFVVDESLPKEIKIAIGVVTALIAGFKWAKTKTV